MNELVDRAKVEDACRVTEELTKIARSRDMADLMIGKILLYIKESEAYKVYSEHTQTFSAYLREIDIGFGVSQAEHYIRTYKTFGEHLKGRTISLKRLLLVHPLVKGLETIEPLLHMCETLPLKALNDEIRERAGKIPTDACPHPVDKREAFYKCSVCHCWLKNNT